MDKFDLARLIHKFYAYKGYSSKITLAEFMEWIESQDD